MQWISTAKMIITAVLLSTLIAACSNKKSAELLVYKSPACGCCGEWIKHMENAGFDATVRDSNDLNTIKNQYGVKPDLQSCHTSVIDGYFFEGHIPADLVSRFLTDPPPDAAGLAVPGMPLGSPGMDMGRDRKDPYDVLLVMKNGDVGLYQHIDGSPVAGQ